MIIQLTIFAIQVGSRPEYWALQLNWWRGTLASLGWNDVARFGSEIQLSFFSRSITRRMLLSNPITQASTQLPPWSQADSEPRLHAGDNSPAATTVVNRVSHAMHLNYKGTRKRLPVVPMLVRRHRASSVQTAQSAL